jgi:hypothetical protein
MAINFECTESSYDSDWLGVMFEGSSYQRYTDNIKLEHMEQLVLLLIKRGWQ